MVAALIGGSEWKGQFSPRSDHKKCSKEGENIIYMSNIMPLPPKAAAHFLS